MEFLKYLSNKVTISTTLLFSPILLSNFELFELNFGVPRSPFYTFINKYGIFIGYAMIGMPAESIPSMDDMNFPSIGKYLLIPLNNRQIN